VVRLSYGHGVDAALSAAGKKASMLMAPLMHSIHRYYVLSNVFSKAPMLMAPQMHSIHRYTQKT
jgi:hypothetical protein